MRKIVIFLILILVFVGFAIIPGNATSPTPAPGNSPLNQLHGSWIKFNPLEPFGTYTFPANQPAYARGGWNSQWMYPEINNPTSKYYWSELTGQEKAEFLRTCKFTLYIDNIPMKLTRFQYYTARDYPNTVSDDTDTMWIIYYIQFDAYDFTPSNHPYYFEGIWSAEIYGILHSYVCIYQVFFI